MRFCGGKLPQDRFCGLVVRGMQKTEKLIKLIEKSTVLKKIKC